MQSPVQDPALLTLNSPTGLGEGTELFSLI
jgi:hypothetical protein